MPTHSPLTELGAFIPTTDVYDVDTIYQMDVNSKDFKEFLVRLRQSINNVALALNIKDTGYYPQEEFVCGQAWFKPTVPATQKSTLRQVFRKIINFGALPNNGIKSIAHGITINNNFPFRFTRVFGIANDTILHLGFPLPYVSELGDNIELNIDATNVNVTTNSDRTNFNITYIIIEYIKQGGVTD